MRIEICGIPGSGKSYVCSSLKNQFAVYNDPSKKKLVKKIIYKLIEKNTFFLHFVDNGSLIIDFIKDYPRCNKSYVRRLAMCFDESYLEYQQDYILDEGVIQNITSIAHDQLIIPNKVLTELVKRYAQKIDKFVYFKSEPEFVLPRIKRRNRKNDRFMVGSDDDILKLLSVKKKNLETVLAIYPEKVIVIDAERCDAVAVENQISQLFMN